MNSESTEKIYLPLLITRGQVNFPDAVFSLDVKRDFSQNAVKMANSMLTRQLVLVSQKDLKVDTPQGNNLYLTGVIGEISSIIPRQDGLKVHFKALHRVHVLSISEPEFDAEGRALNEAIFGAEVELIPEVINSPAYVDDLTQKIKQLIGEVQAESPILRQVNLRNEQGKTGSEFAYAVYNVIQTDIGQRQRFLETPTVDSQLEQILEAVEGIRRSGAIERDLQQKVRESSEKNQREYFLREKMKAIKKELGEDVDDDKSEEGILKKLDSNPYPEHVRTKVKNELKRYNLMPQASLESSLIKQYIDILMEIPWYQMSEDDDDLKKAQEILDEDHYGLEKEKKRIIEYLAVKKMTSSLKAPILCLYGPPGVGKTSLARSVARALNRKFFKASLGGISDEAEIRGHRRTYVGSMPGRIINGMRKCGVRNPVFLLDEVDKLSKSYQGNPAAALLEVLDPSQNYQFNDNYVEESYDLSDVLFIATANYIEDVPEPLRDRLELIEVSSYTHLEKIEIASRHLVPKEMLTNGLNPEQIVFSKEAISYIIEHYTREAGVRELQRKIGAVCRQAVVEILSDNKPELPIHINTKKAKQYLGVEIFLSDDADKVDQIGVVTGLAYTSYGGEILPIEVNYFTGKGQLVLTGKLGEVMRESASIALDYVKANATKYNIDPQLYLENDIHIHVPEGAVPKDGPSAGVAITTAIISCLTRIPVRHDVAMTGEVTLRGNALPIGGLREKSLAAMRHGIKTIIVPEGNKRMANDLPKEAKESLKIVFMNNVDDALKVALTNPEKKD